MLRRTAASLAAIGLLLALAAPAFASTDLHQTVPAGGIPWTDLEFQGSLEECAEAVEDFDLQPGDVLWHFILNQTDATSGNLTATFANEGEVTVANYPSNSNNLHWAIITGEDNLLGAWTDADGGQLNLSHICSVPDEEIPEAPFALLLPIIALAAFGGYLFLNRRRVLDAA